MLDQKQQINKQIEKANNIVIILPENADGDAIGTALACHLLLSRMEKKSDVVGRPSAFGKEQEKSLWSFLPGYEDISSGLENLRNFIVSLDIKQAKIGQIKYQLEDNILNFIISPKEGWFDADDISTSASGFKYDLIITVGAPDLESLGSIYDNNIEFFYKTAIINIDHSAANEEFGQINAVDINATSCSEIACSLIEGYKPEAVDADIATCLLAGMIHKTKNFKTSNITPNTLLTVSRLIDRGARREEIVNLLYRSKDFKVLKLWGQVLDKLETSAGGSLIWSEISAAALAESGATSRSLLEIIDELIINLPEAGLIIFFIDGGGEASEALVYSVKNINAKEIIKDFGAEGQAKVARCNIAASFPEAKAKILEIAENKLENIKKAA